jgi:hypothetical protein
VTPTPELRSRILGAIRDVPAPPRAVVLRRRAIAFVIAFVPLIAFEMYDLRLGDRPLGFVVANVTGWALLAFVATLGAVGRGTSMLGRPRGWLIAIALLLPPLLLALAALAYGPWPQAMTIDCTGAGDMNCCAFTLGLAVGPLAAFAYARRESDPVHPRLTGAALGASAGAWAAVSMALHCPVTSLRHVVVGHIVPVVAFALIGLLVGSKVLAVRSRDA